MVRYVVLRARVKRTEWLTVRDIAFLVHVSEDTVRRWIRKEKLGAKDLGVEPVTVSGGLISRNSCGVAHAPKADIDGGVLIARPIGVSK